MINIGNIKMHKLHNQVDIDAFLRIATIDDIIKELRLLRENHDISLNAYSEDLKRMGNILLELSETEE